MIRRSILVVELLMFVSTLLLSPTIGHTQPSFLPRELSWETIGEDLELLTTEIDNSFFFSSQLTAIRTSLSKYRVSVLRALEHGRQRLDVRRICEGSKALIGINANFFDEQGRPLGLVTSRGNNLQGMHLGGETLTGVFFATRDNVGILNRSAFHLTAALEAIQAGPRLVVGGRKLARFKDKSSVSSRSSVCIDENNRLIFTNVQSQFSGLTIPEFAELHTHPAIRCQDVLNLDGGGSSQLFVSGEIPGRAKKFMGIEIVGQDEVPIVLGLVLK